MIKTILITGGSGLIGTHLSNFFLEKEYNVIHLSRSPGKNENKSLQVYKWDVKKKEIDSEALLKADCIINLAGAGLADKRWKPSRKKEIVESRTESTALLINKLKELNHKPDLFIGVSAIGIYGDSGDKWVDEKTSPASDFLADVCIKWEEATEQIITLGIPFIINRIGLVLSNEGGALKEIEKPLKFGIAGYLGNGQQYMSWVHIEDLCRQFLHCIEGKTKVNEIYNAVAPNPEKNIDFTITLSKVAKKGILMPTPKFALKLMLGEMANMVLTGQRVSSEKIQKTGFEYKFKSLKSALQNLYSKS